MPKDNEVMLSTLRELDKRKIADRAELLEIAKLYNVKAQIHRAGIPLKKLDKSIYQKVRETAVSNLLLNGGGTIEGLINEIERIIRDGNCGLDRRMVMLRDRWR